MNKYLIKSEGDWNMPHITSKTIGNYSGYEPLYNGGCFAIVPHNDKFILFGEDDDNYWEKETITKEELLDLQKIYSGLADEIEVTIDYIKCVSKSKYSISKKDFFRKERSLGKWKVKITGRSYGSPLVYINEDSFDVFHAKARLEVINKILKELL